MKKRTWFSFALVVLCLAVFFGYRAVKRLGADTKAPQINMSAGADRISVQATADILLQGITAEDETDGDVTASLVVERVRLLDSDGNAVVNYAAFDRAGNVAKANRQVKYSDYESPRFSLERPLLFAQNASLNVLDCIRATDVFDGNITRRIRATFLTENMAAIIGTHEVELRVTNSMGDTVVLKLPVEIYSAGTYQGSLSLTEYLIYLPVGTTFQPKDYLGSFTMGHETISLKNGVPKDFSLQISGTVDTKKPGVYSVGYTLTQCDTDDREESRSYSGYSKLIVVVED